MVNLNLDFGSNQIIFGSVFWGGGYTWKTDLFWTSKRSSVGQQIFMQVAAFATGNMEWLRHGTEDLGGISSVRWLGGISERGGYRNDDMRIGIFPSGYGNDWFLDHTYGNRTVVQKSHNSDVRKTTASGTLQRPTSLTMGRFFVHPRWTLGKVNLFWPSNWLTMCM